MTFHKESLLFLSYKISQFFSALVFNIIFIYFELTSKKNESTSAISRNYRSLSQYCNSGLFLSKYHVKNKGYGNGNSNGIIEVTIFLGGNIDATVFLALVSSSTSTSC